MSKFYDEIKGSLVERECEAVYNKGINLYFPDVNITHPFACDGFLDTKTMSGKILKLMKILLYLCGVFRNKTA